MKFKKLVSLFLVANFIFFNFNVNAVENYCQGYADIVAPLLPAVVNISITSKNNHESFNKLQFPQGSPFEEFNKLFEKYDLMPDEEEVSEMLVKPHPAGSGFLVSADGYIVSNYHVIEHADKIVVTLSDDQKLDAKLIGFDNRTDLAVLKISSKNPLPFVKFGDSNQSRVGDIVIAIGNPFGLGGTVTSGIISAQARDIGANSLNIIDNFIQTDAAVNQGNSGGPMFNTKGEVIGINFAIVSPTGNNIGIGFAIPSSAAQPIVEQLIKTGKVNRGWLGIALQPTDTVSESLGLEEGVGALVSNVTSGSAAEKAGIEVGDVILKFDGRAITSSKKLPRIVAETPVGKKVNVEIMSKGKRKNIVLTVGEMDSKNDKDEKAADLNAAKKALYGMNISEITPELRQKYAIANNVNGILVTSLDRRSVASKHGIKRGDVINAINQNLVTKPEELFKFIEDARVNKRKSIMLLIQRSGGSVFLSLPVSEK